MRHVAFLLLLLLAPSLGFAANKAVKVRGVIGLCGTDECGIGGLGQGYSFVPHTKIAYKILSICDMGIDCVIEGVVNERDYFVSLSSVKRIDTKVEPSVKVITEAACWLYSKDCDECSGTFNVDYIDLLRMEKMDKKIGNVWRIQFVLHGVENFVHKNVGPGEVFLVERQGSWHFYKTRP